jgi:hypothetical protein
MGRYDGEIVGIERYQFERVCRHSQKIPTFNLRVS